MAEIIKYDFYMVSGLNLTLSCKGLVPFTMFQVML